jgi:biopolymer transport protein ExbD
MNFRGRYRTENPGFQLAPMIDIVFLLLCFFVAAQIFSQWEMSIDVQLPTAQSGEVPDRLPGEIIINVLGDGAIVVNQQNLNDESLSALLCRIVGLFPGQPILIRADKSTAYEHVIRVLDLCRKVDIWNISFATTAVNKTS